MIAARRPGAAGSRWPHRYTADARVAQPSLQDRATAVKHRLPLAYLIAGMLILAGCGNKGPLRLPAPTHAQPAAAASSSVLPPALPAQR